MTASEELDALFPLPTRRQDSFCPDWLPGVTSESKLAVSRVLKANHEQRHAFINEYGFHNHTSHHLLAVFALGAPPPIFDAIFGDHKSRTLPTLESPGVIDEDNFFEHLGKRVYYDAYLQHFHKVVLEKGASAAMEEYLFSPAANFSETQSDSQRQMLTRTFSMLFHPMIYLGYGLEFGIPGLVAEGLAQIATHPLQGEGLITREEFRTQSGVTTGASGFVSSFASLLLNKERSLSAPKSTNVHALTILARVLRDERFSSTSIRFAPVGHRSEILSHYSQVLAELGDVLRSYVKEWYMDYDDPARVESKVEELCWTNTLLYSVGGWGGRNVKAGKTFTADFFLMHMVTSSIFVSSTVTYLSPSSIVQFLRAYFISSIAWWVARGRPLLPIREFYAAVTATPVPYGTVNVKPTHGTLSTEVAPSNPWLPILQTTIVHQDDHIGKLQRALAHFATKYGDRPKGHLSVLADVDDVSLDGVEVLDGTLFIRAAGLTANELGWMKEGQARGEWSIDAFY
ncbi:uncharacterized protein FIBRA_02217 [Fibroporia radiculosa]|uniref:Uncharacterized protein n=1 Tax=Fibroporia radiculosa TaxID=599839 RepID=J4H1Q6_9APHY|nr:uncharacterized protein FIBRA_02217 [Fibroporia radiculosa]CCM00189.1 predicted protein [Fibroporia radiculosa]